MTGIPRWTSRLRITSHLVHVGVFIVAVAAAAADDGVTAQVLSATVLSAVGVLAAFTVPIPLVPGRRDQVAALLVAPALFVVAIALTGGVNSAFVLMPIASIFLAAFAGGARFAAPVALMAIAGVLLATVAIDEDAGVDALIRIPVIYAVTAIAFSEVHRALTSETERVDDLLLASRTATERRERLEATHLLLEDLLRIATSPDVNAVAAAQDALRDIAIVVPDATTRIVADGSTNLARRGEPPDAPPDLSVPVDRSGTIVARLDLWQPGSTLTPKQRSAIGASLEPVGLALENDAMVQQLAGLAIQRERVRLARELHDDVAPSIAAVGLALDMVLLDGSLDDEPTRTLEATRSNVTSLVERVRNRVQDLRADRSMSLVELAHSLVAEVDTDGPTVVVDIDERTPPRPAVAMEVSALITEAFRNAVAHADASMIRISGRVDEASGQIVVDDNGGGFDAEESPSGHYGLVGMRERAGLIGAELDVASRIGDGTTVTIAWKDGR